MIAMLFAAYESLTNPLQPVDERQLRTVLDGGNHQPGAVGP
jgi:hypothetical protein